MLRLLERRHPPHHQRFLLLPYALPHAGSLIIWPVSDLVLNDSESRDARAIEYYQDIYNNSYSAGEVDETCLGVLQYTACARTYPTCANEDDSVE
jgi:hypothetical protein